MKKTIILIGVLTMILVTGCGRKKVILGHDEPELRPVGVEEILVENIEVENIEAENIEVEKIIH
ncbi:MAG: hypothetical protein ILA11_11135 [Butyrivibrio sp.]|nr:hypothetical protein [Butyrivibrio sp.]